MTAELALRHAAHLVEVTPRTRWIFVELHAPDGRIGTGEATLTGQERTVMAHIARLAAGLHAATHLPAPASLAEAAAVSALDLARADLAAQDAGLPLAAHLGELRRTHVPLYANINRRTRDRSPAGFAASARDAAAAGFDTIKLAPFDEVPPPPAARPEDLAAAMAPGLARIAAVRAALDPACAVMVDCHWRFTPAETPRLVDAVAERGASWLECPMPEIDATVAALVATRRQANSRGMRLAGLEQAVGLAGFLPWLRAGAYDVMMPDAKYVGGLAEMLRVAAALAAHGVVFSPHNPTGPVCHGASLHACAVAPALDRLEVQFDETPVFAALVGGAVPAQARGISALPPGTGLGLRLDPAHLAGLAVETA